MSRKTVSVTDGNNGDSDATRRCYYRASGLDS